MTDGMSPLGDLAAVEYRVAQLSSDSKPATSAATISQNDSVAAFQALLAASSSGFSGGGPPQTASSPIAPAALESLIAKSAAQNGEDPALIKAIVANESSFNPAATSPVGAQGLMQLMPATAAEVGVGNAYDPAQNIAGGTRYLSQLLARFDGNVPQAIAAYNAGPEAVAAGHIPAETRAYVTNVLGSYERYGSQR